MRSRIDNIHQDVVKATGVQIFQILNSARCWTRDKYAGQLRCPFPTVPRGTSSSLVNGKLRSCARIREAGGTN